MPLQATSGAASYDAFGGGVAAVPNYIEDVFSTYLYTGNDSSQTITNGIDLAGKGGLVWVKSRAQVAAHELVDTVRGADNRLFSNLTAAQDNSGSVHAFNSNGFTLRAAGLGNLLNEPTASWTFRKQPKFFDVVTYTGNGGTLSVSHALASKPGCIIIKKTSGTGDWLVCTRKSDGNIYAMYLNTTAGQFYDGTEGSLWTSSAVSINWINSNVAGGFNDSGATYVMYVLAHNAGGFGLTGTDNVISCGSFTSTGSVLSVNLGYEPQWLLYKESSTTGDWKLIDNMRGFQVDRSGSTVALYPNLSSAESALGLVGPTSTGFTFDNGGSGVTYIYIAIRRGPMKVPTSGTSVFLPQLANTSAPTYRASFTIDMVMALQRTGGSHYIGDRLRGAVISDTTSTAAEASYANEKWDYQTSALSYASGPSYEVGQCFRRAPGFFDEVCYTGTGVATTVAHNLGVAPEMMIVKSRGTDFTNWIVYHAAMGNTYYENLNYDFAKSGPSADVWSSTNPSSSVFSTGAFNNTNGSGRTFVASLFATCAGVSKVGSYTGTGTTQQINCGFTAGSRFVLIKRTDSTGDWYVWDSARGIVAGTDPYLLLNSTAAEVTSTDYVDTYSAGFELTSTAPAALNASGGSYIFLAIA